MSYVFCNHQTIHALIAVIFLECPNDFLRVIGPMNSPSKFCGLYSSQDSQKSVSESKIIEDGAYQERSMAA